MAKVQDCDIAVVGGGPTGLCAALLLAKAGYGVVRVAPPAGDDGRAVALLQSSLEILEGIGVRDQIVAAGSPLAVMRLVDDTGRLLRAPEIAFRASELGLPAFGYSVQTADLNSILERQAGRIGTISHVAAAATHVEPGPDRVLVTTDADIAVDAALVVGADGRRSLCRTASGLSMKSWSYRQAALVTTVRHSRPHDSISTEFHTRNGPFTLVPIGTDRCGLVWVDRPGTIERWKNAETSELAREIERRSHSILGRIEVEAPARVTPMSGGYLPVPAARRIALVGEAAHHFPPIGAQGLNLGLRDCGALARAVGIANPDPGRTETLDRYSRSRRADVAARTYGVDLLNRSLLVDFFPVQLARVMALGLADMAPPLRGVLMRLGMAAPLTWN